MTEPPSVRYVILRHEGIAQPHFDLMFEKQPGSDLVTWRSPIWPIGPDPVPVERLDDHRRAYLEYEGEISGGRGNVRRIESGQCQVFPYVEFQWTAKLLDHDPPSYLFLQRSPQAHWVATMNAVAST